MNKKYFLLLAACCLSLLFSTAQNKISGSLYIDTLEQRITNAKTIALKIETMADLASFYLDANIKEKVDSIAGVILSIGESSNDKKILFAAYNTAGTLTYYNKRNAGDLIKKAYDLAVKEKLKNETVIALISLSKFELTDRGQEKAMELLNQADLGEDAVTNKTRSDFYMTKSFLYLVKQENLNSFKCLFNAKKYAEKANDPKAVRSVNIALAINFKNIKAYEKSLGYYKSLIADYQKINKPASIAKNKIEVGNLYKELKQYDSAEKAFNEAIILSEEIGNENSKHSAIAALCALYNDNGDKKYVDVIKKYDLLAYYLRKGLYHTYLLTKGDMFYFQNERDSFEYYYLKAINVFDSLGYRSFQAGVLRYMGSYYRKKGDNNKSLLLLKQALVINDTLQEITTYKELYNELDSTYRTMGDYKEAYNAKANYLLYKDSIDNMSNTEDILRAEIDAEEESQQKKAESEEQATLRRHNIQYTGIILGGFALLISLLVLAFFNVPKWLIRVLGFLSFIFLFEFIILLLDTKIHSWTHGEPLPVLLIKIVIACILIPLHHYLEHKVINFLQSRKLHRLKTVFKEVPATDAKENI